MSEPCPTRRRVYVVELKEHQALKVDRGCGVQLRRVGDALAEIAATNRAIPADGAYESLLGDMRLVLAHLGVDVPHVMDDAADALNLGRTQRIYA